MPDVVVGTGNGTVQERAWVGDVLPPVKQVRPGRRTVPVPIADPPGRPGQTLVHCVLPEVGGRVRRNGDSPALVFVAEH